MRTELFFTLLILASAAQGQSFNAGSTGADGALVLTAPGTIVFDPRTFNPPLNPGGDNVYHFTSVYIGKDVTVRLSSRILNSPVFWLASGPVEIEGTLDLNGDDGDRVPSTAGAGGYPGAAVRGRGYGPEGTFTPNIFLVPLVGGSGGDGGETKGGGAGGGALLIASSTSISIRGVITANGGSSQGGSGGSGGSIRLVAPVIDGSTGLVSAKGGQPGGGDGRVRFEAVDNRFSGSLNDTPFSQGKPFGLFLPPGPPASVRVVSVGGVAINRPDFTINLRSPTTIVVEARFVPPGTVVELQFFSEDGAAYTVSTTPLEGTLKQSRATASATFPSGLSRCYVNASWKRSPSN